MLRQSGGLCACLLNISEARNLDKVHQVVASALSINDNRPSIRCSVLNVFNDYDYNRSVITIAAKAEDIGASVQAACEKAFDVIDLSKHEGGHPRLGAVDLVPIHPLSGDVTLHQCGQVANGIAKHLSSSVPGSSFFLFGAADNPSQRGLVQRRKDVGWFAGKHGSLYQRQQVDVGAEPVAQRGVTGIGAIPYVMNCNVTIDTQNLALGRSIAKAIRATTPGGFPGLQSMAFHHEGKIEIACNVEGICVDSDSDRVDDLVCSFGNYYNVPPETIESRIKELASVEGVMVAGMALVGFSPKEAHSLASLALSTNVGDYWKLRQSRQM